MSLCSCRFLASKAGKCADHEPSSFVEGISPHSLSSCSGCSRSSSRNNERLSWQTGKLPGSGETGLPCSGHGPSKPLRCREIRELFFIRGSLEGVKKPRVLGCLWAPTLNVPEVKICRYSEVLQYLQQGPRTSTYLHLRNLSQ